MWYFVVGVHFLFAMFIYFGKLKMNDKVNGLYDFTVTFLLTAVFNMCVVSYDRLTAIVLPMEKRITMRSAKMAMFLTWMVGLMVSIPFAVYRNYKVSFESVLSRFRRMNCVRRCMHTDSRHGGVCLVHGIIQYIVVFVFVFGHLFRHPAAMISWQERHWKNFVEKYCVENITILSVYWHIILVLLVLCPLIVMIICYSAIFWKVSV